MMLSTEKGFKKHVNKLEQVLTQLQEACLKINAVKSFFAQTNLEYLSYNISREGLRPSQKKVETILQIKAPTSCKQLRQFIGMVNYYHMTCGCSAHTSWLHCHQ
jgi:3-methyladenine DNA glycosylase Tag